MSVTLLKLKKEPCLWIKQFFGVNYLPSGNKYAFIFFKNLRTKLVCFSNLQNLHHFD